jgi:hypothetical protein
VALVLALLVVFPYADTFRNTTDIGAFDFQGVDPLVEKGDYDAFQQLLNAELYVAEEGHTFGRQALGTLLFWIPRRFWGDKPVHSGEIVSEAMGYSHTNRAMPLWGEAFLDGGLPLVLLAFVAYGFLSGALERGFVVEHRDDSLIAVFVPVLAGYQLFLLRGALMSAFAYLVPIVALIAIATRRARAETGLRATRRPGS